MESLKVLVSVDTVTGEGELEITEELVNALNQEDNVLAARVTILNVLNEICEALEHTIFGEQRGDYQGSRE